ncbi:MAG: WxcM-like protein [Acidimicrobiaceae bacterium]|jgi:dTDP-4-dehydrorhamnose 3,5-epimerase-like enzyme|nr:WxcM-like protein [Acidimicrobiaceae bacterium]
MGGTPRGECSVTPVTSTPADSHLDRTRDKTPYASRELGRCRLIDLPVINDPRGNLTSIEGNRQLPFGIARVYYTYDIPSGAARGGHAHRQCEVLVISMSGSFDVRVHDGLTSAQVTLDSSKRGLYLPAMVWRELDRFSSGAVCMVLASDIYRESDYIRDFDSFMEEYAH